MQDASRYDTCNQLHALLLLVPAMQLELQLISDLGDEGTLLSAANI
jgi:hypothetical protein